MKVYSFLNNVLLVNGVEITGWADGDDAISMSRLTDSASHKIGADGTMMVSLSADRSGEFTFKLQQTSPSNKYLTSLLIAQDSGVIQFTPINVLFTDTYRNDQVTSTVGYLKKPADMVRGMGGNVQEWTIVVERIDLLHGDPLFVGGAIGSLLGV